MRLHWLPPAFVVALAAPLACEGTGPAEIAIAPGSGGSGDALVDGGTPLGDAGDASASPDAADAGASPLYVGITANPLSSTHEGPTFADDVAAELTTFAAGVRVVALSWPLREMNAETAAKLAARAATYAKHEKRVLFNVAVVDRVADQRPDSVAMLPWTHAATTAVLRAAIDDVVGAFGDGLAYLTFGRDVDAYLAEHAGQRDQLEDALAEAFDYARSHPGAPAGLRVGAGFSHEATAELDPSFAELLAAGDIAVVSYLPGLDEGQAEPASGLAKSLDAIAAAAAGKPVVLQAVGYPSSDEAGSSPEKQRLFFETLFAALAPRRGAFDVANVVQLHDLAPGACDAWAASQGEEPGSELAAFACSTGLFTAEGAPKPAWSVVLAGVAQFAAP